jgi:hypothetical protein
VDIPDEFVAPSRSSRSAKTRSKHQGHADKTSVPSRVYSKRPTGPTGSSSSNDSTKRPTGTSGTRASTKTSHSTTPAPALQPVDFIYDVRIRSKLREEIDRERATVREAVLARETQLRTEHKWVSDGPGADKPSRREAWASDPSTSCSHRTGTQTPSSRSSSTGSRRTGTSTAASAASERKSRPPPTSSSVGPHVSDWQHQTAPRVGPSRQEADLQRRTRARHERERQQEAQGVAVTLDAFERAWAGLEER